MENPQDPSAPPAQAPYPTGPQAAQQPEEQYYTVAFILKCVWLFLLGILLAVVGLYCLIYRPDMGANSFIIMLMGLFFTAAGSIYGKRKFRGETAAMIPAEPQPLQAQFMQQLQELGIPAQQLVRSLEAQAAPKPQEPQPEPQTPAPVAPPPPPPGEPKIFRIFVCPKCGAENQMDDQFCYKCGTKFIKPKKRAGKAKKPAKQTKVKTKKPPEPLTEKAPKAKTKAAKKKARKARVQAGPEF